MANPISLDKKTFFVVTGASKGIGQAMAIECAKKFQPDSVVVLLARSTNGLAKTKEQILLSNPNIKVFTYSIDLTDASAEEYTKLLENSKGNSDNFELAFIIHNVGSIGDVKKAAKQFNNQLEWNQYFGLNVFSVATLNSVFLNLHANTKRLIVNITSLCAVQTYKSFTQYCTGKAAREMYFKMIAREELDVTVLNYSPGVVDTDMTVIVQDESADPNIRSYYAGMRNDKTMVTPVGTSLKMIEIIEKGDYKSGDKYDYNK